MLFPQKLFRFVPYLRAVEEMTINQLKIFDAVARHVNVTKAAREIRISQPTASKQLRLLEDEFGLKFHLRIGQGIRLTEDGLLFWSTVRPILQQIENLGKTFRTGIRQARFLRVAGTESPSTSLLPEALKAFKMTHPDVQPILRTSSSEAIEQLVLNYGVEIGFINNPSYHPQIITQPLRSEEVIAVVSARHPLAKKATLSQEEFAKVPLVIRTGGRNAKQLEQMGFKLNIVMECESSEIVKAAVRSGIGMGLLYRDIVESDLRTGYLKAIEIPELKRIDVKSFIIYHKGIPLSPAAQDFLAFLPHCREPMVAKLQSAKN